MCFLNYTYELHVLSMFSLNQSITDRVRSSSQAAVEACRNRARNSSKQMSGMIRVSKLFILQSGVSTRDASLNAGDNNDNAALGATGKKKANFNLSVALARTILVRRNEPSLDTSCRLLNWRQHTSSVGCFTGREPNWLACIIDDMLVELLLQRTTTYTVYTW